MTQPQATRSIIDSHRHIFGPKLRQKLVENMGLDDSKPFPQVFGDEMFFYRESVDIDYSMEIQRQSGVTLCVKSYGGEVETFAQHVIKASTVDTLKFLNDESFELRDRFPDEVACMANAHALEESSRDVIDPLISNKEACCISITTSYGAGADQIFLDSPKAEWLWEYAQAKDVLVHVHPPLVAIGAVAMQKYRLNEAVGRPFDTALSAASTANLKSLLSNSKTRPAAALSSQPRHNTTSPALTYRRQPPRRLISSRKPHGGMTAGRIVHAESRERTRERHRIQAAAS
jgi:hypothetical protein